MDLEQKYKKLIAIIGQYDSLLIAFSGGIDSTLLLKIAYDVLGEKTLAVTSDSPSIARSELMDAKRICANIGARHLIINTQEIENPNYSDNPPNRCYFCKFELYSSLIKVAKKHKIKYISNGTNYSDWSDYRPGLQAAEEFKIVSPLSEVQLSKEQLRSLAKKLDIEIWDKPASPCLASRIPYYNKVTPKKLETIEKAETFLKNLGIRELRVRHFSSKARIETHASDFKIIEENLLKIKTYFKDLGFDEIETKEFKSGALNALIKQNV